VRDLPAVKDLLPFFIIGITSGSVYAIAGMGLTLTFKTSGIFNFSHGALAACAAFVMYDLGTRSHWPWPVAALVAVVIAGLGGGVVLERLAWLLADAPAINRVVATVGLLVFLQGVLVIRYGAASIQFKQFLPTGLTRLPGVSVSANQFIVTGLALAAAIGLYLFFKRSRLGAAMVGVVDDPALLALNGTSPIVVRRYAWMVGSTFAAVSGLLLAPLVGLNSSVLTLLVVYSFGAAAIGSFTSLSWTYAGGLAVGIAVAYSQRYLAVHLAFHALPPNLPVIVLFVALLVTPKRLLVQRGTKAVRRMVPPIQFSRRAVAIAVIAGGVFLVFVPQMFSDKLPSYTTAVAFVGLFASLGLVIRTSGQMSLCQMAFAAVGASTTARLIGAGLPWLPGLLLGGVVAMAVGALVAVPAIRLSGIYLAIATFGFGVVLQNLFYGTFLVFGGAYRLHSPRPHLGLLHLDTDAGYYYVVLAGSVLCCLVVVAVRRIRLGRLLRAMADSPAALDAHGTNTNITRLYVFSISAFVAGIAGALLAAVTQSATPTTFDYSTSLLMIAVLGIAGSQPVLSAFIAAALLQVTPAYIHSSRLNLYQPVVFGAVAIVVAAFPLRRIVSRSLSTGLTALRRGRSPVRARAELAGAPRAI
jgi:branched-subunit amino acid ABC-type transport system permease component